MKTYFFTNNINRYVKIGKSISPHNRAMQVTGQWPFVKISIFYVIDGDFENHFHSLYRENRVCGEWFDIPDLNIDKIEEIILPLMQIDAI